MVQGLIDEILMGTTIASTIAVGFFATIGVILSVLIQNAVRDVAKEDSPQNFSSKYFFKYNLTRLLLAVLLSFVILVTTGETLGNKANIIIGLPCGLLTDLVSYYLLKWAKNILNNLLKND